MKVETIYINMKNSDGKVETVDEFTSDQHATKEDFNSYVAAQLNEYKRAFKGLEVYTSGKAAKEWLDR